MARPDKVFVEFRGEIATAIGGTFGDSDLVCVKSDSSGNLTLAGQGEAEGVIWTPEGKSDSSVANYKTATAGTEYTVFQVAQFVDTMDIADGLSIWSVASGAVSTSAPGAGTVQKIGTVYRNDNGESRLVINVPLAD